MAAETLEILLLIWKIYVFIRYSLQMFVMAFIVSSNSKNESGNVLDLKWNIWSFIRLFDLNNNINYFWISKFVTILNRQVFGELRQHSDNNATQYTL